MKVSRAVFSLAQVVLEATLFVAILVATTIAIAAAIGWLRGVGLAEAGNLRIGLVCGLVSWLFLAVFHIRKEAMEIPRPDSPHILEKIKVILADMGYDFVDETPTSVTTRPRFQALLFGGGIHVQLTLEALKLTGPRMNLEMLRRRLRWLNHLEMVHHDLQEARDRAGDCRLKRAQLNLRFTPEHFAEVGAHVVEVLADHADVICDLHLLANNDAGFSESLLQIHIGEWLARAGIPYELHKDLVQMNDDYRSDSSDELIPILPLPHDLSQTTMR